MMKRIGNICVILGVAGCVVFPVLTNLSDYKKDYALGGWLSFALCVAGIILLMANWFINWKTNTKKESTNKSTVFFARDGLESMI